MEMLKRIVCVLLLRASSPFIIVINRVALQIVWWLNADAIVNLCNTWRRSGGSLGLLKFSPKLHGASKDYLAADCLDHDLLRIDLCIALERLCAFTLNLCRLSLRLGLNEVGDALDTSQPADRAFHSLAIDIRIDLTLA